MGLEKIGAKFITAWAKAGEKSLLATRPVKVNTWSLKYATNLTHDTVSFTNNSYISEQFVRALTNEKTPPARRRWKFL